MQLKNIMNISEIYKGYVSRKLLIAIFAANSKIHVLLFCRQA